jgi:hypothetical protein
VKPRRQNKPEPDQSRLSPSSDSVVRNRIFLEGDDLDPARGNIAQPINSDGQPASLAPAAVGREIGTPSIPSRPRRPLNRAANKGLR